MSIFIAPVIMRGGWLARAQLISNCIVMISRSMTKMNGQEKITPCNIFLSQMEGTACHDTFVYDLLLVLLSVASQLAPAEMIHTSALTTTGAMQWKCWQSFFFFFSELQLVTDSLHSTHANGCRLYTSLA